MKKIIALITVLYLTLLLLPSDVFVEDSIAGYSGVYSYTK